MEDSQRQSSARSCDSNAHHKGVRQKPQTFHALFSKQESAPAVWAESQRKVQGHKSPALHHCVCNFRPSPLLKNTLRSKHSPLAGCRICAPSTRIQGWLLFTSGKACSKNRVQRNSNVVLIRQVHLQLLRHHPRLFGAAERDTDTDIDICVYIYIYIYVYIYTHRRTHIHIYTYVCT